MLAFKKQMLRMMVLLVILQVISSAPMKKIKNNPMTWLNPANSQKKTPQTTIVISPQDIGRYINQIRSAPYSMVQVLEEKIRKRQFRNLTEWNDAINYIKNLEKVPTCNYSVVLERTAMDHAQQLMSKKSLTHIGNNGSSMVQRIQKYTDWNNGTVSQVIIYEPTFTNRNHPLEILISMIVSEGIPSKHNRKALFNPQYRYYGVSVRLQGGIGVAVFLFSTQLFKLDYPDEQAQQQKRRKLSDILQSDTPVPQFFGGRRPSNILQGNKPINDLFGSFKIGGKKINNRVNLQNSQQSSSKGVVTAIVTSNITQNVNHINIRPKRTIKKIFQDGKQTVQIL